MHIIRSGWYTSISVCYACKRSFLDKTTERVFKKNAGLISNNRIVLNHDNGLYAEYTYMYVLLAQGSLTRQCFIDLFILHQADQEKYNWATSWENLSSGFATGKTQTESWNFGFIKFRYYIIQTANNKDTDQTAYRLRTTKALIRLRGCAGWSAPFCSHIAKTVFLTTWLIHVSPNLILVFRGFMFLLWTPCVALFNGLMTSIHEYWYLLSVVSLVIRRH